MMHTILYQDSNYRVLSSCPHPNRGVLICFNNRIPQNKKDEPEQFMGEFGKNVGLALGINELIVQTNKNDWYQSDSILNCLKFCLSSIDYSGEIFTFGSSMGAYAAINLSSELNANFFFAFSPQYTIKSNYYESVGDVRFKEERQWIEPPFCFLSEKNSSFKNGLIVSDMNHIDASHTNSILSKCDDSVSLINLENCCHPTTPLFNRLYGLKKILLECIESHDNKESIKIIVKKTTEELRRKNKNQVGYVFNELVVSQESDNSKTIEKLSALILTHGVSEILLKKINYELTTCSPEKLQQISKIIAFSYQLNPSEPLKRLTIRMLTKTKETTLLLAFLIKNNFNQDLVDLLVNNNEIEFSQSNTSTISTPLLMRAARKCLIHKPKRSIALTGIVLNRNPNHSIAKEVKASAEKSLTSKETESLIPSHQ